MAESATSVGSLTFLGLFAMFSLSPRYLYASPRGLAAIAPRKTEASAMPCGAKARPIFGLSDHPENILLGERYE